MNSEQDYFSAQNAAAKQVHYTQAGSMLGSAGYATEVAQTEPSLTDHIGQGLEALRCTLADAYDCLANLSDRVLGPQPVPVTNGSQGIAGIPSAASSLKAQ